jgi:hypothetical protein
MRSIEETQEPRLLYVIGLMILDGGREVEIEQDEATGTAVVYYRQRIKYRDLYGLGVLQYLKRQFARSSINELLIIMGAARYDPEQGRMTARASAACRIAQEKADLALWEEFRARPLEEYERDPARAYVSWGDGGYRARIPKGDVPERDRNLAEGHRRIEELPPAGVTAPEAVAALCRALRDHNRLVRRKAARRLRNSGAAADEAITALTDALDDPDVYVRKHAAGSLGKIGPPAARSAPRIRLLLNDWHGDVRAAAAQALKRLKAE